MYITLVKSLFKFILQMNVISSAALQCYHHLNCDCLYFHVSFTVCSFYWSMHRSPYLQNALSKKVRSHSNSYEIL